MLWWNDVLQLGVEWGEQSRRGPKEQSCDKKETEPNQDDPHLPRFLKQGFRNAPEFCFACVFNTATVAFYRLALRNCSAPLRGSCGVDRPSTDFMMYAMTP